MIQLLSDAPAETAAFEATGKITSDDFKTVVIPEIDRIVAAHDKIRFLLLLNTDISNFDMGAWAQDLAVGMKHLTKWHKMAIVSDQPMVNKFSDAASLMLPGESKSFSIADLGAAKTWVSS